MKRKPNHLPRREPILDADAEPCVCGKKSYPGMGAAREAIRRLRLHDRDHAYKGYAAVYRCQYSGRVHIGHTEAE